MIKQVFGIAGVVLIAAGCASTAHFEQMMPGSIGAPISQIQQRFGYNFIERKLEDGMTAYTWSRSQSGTLPGYASPTEVRTITSGDSKRTTVMPGTFFPPESYEMVCEFTFIANQQQRVSAWRAHGNGCARFERDSYMGSGNSQ